MYVCMYVRLCVCTGYARPCSCDFIRNVDRYTWMEWLFTSLHMYVCVCTFAPSPHTHTHNFPCCWRRFYLRIPNSVSCFPLPLQLPLNVFLFSSVFFYFSSGFALVFCSCFISFVIFVICLAVKGSFFKLGV